jgi:hypothetical protein
MVKHASRDMDTYAPDVVPADLDLAGMQPGADLDAKRAERVSQCGSTSDRPAWPVERRQNTVPR